MEGEAYLDSLEDVEEGVALDQSGLPPQQRLQSLNPCAQISTFRLQS